RRNGRGCGRQMERGRMLARGHIPQNLQAPVRPATVAGEGVRAAVSGERNVRGDTDRTRPAGVDVAALAQDQRTAVQGVLAAPGEGDAADVAIVVHGDRAVGADDRTKDRYVGAGRRGDVTGNAGRP